MDNIWCPNLADTQLISKVKKKSIWFLLCVIDMFRRDAWIVPLEGKKGITITNVFQKNLHESNRKPNKMWVNKGSEFYNRNHGCNIMIQNSIQHIMKASLLLLKDL